VELVQAPAEVDLKRLENKIEIIEEIFHFPIKVLQCPAFHFVRANVRFCHFLLIRTFRVSWFGALFDEFK